MALKQQHKAAAMAWTNDTKMAWNCYSDRKSTNTIVKYNSNMASPSIHKTTGVEISRENREGLIDWIADSVFLKTCYLSFLTFNLAPVVRKLDIGIHRINHCPVDKC